MEDLAPVEESKEEAKEEESLDEFNQQNGKHNKQGAQVDTGLFEQEEVDQEEEEPNFDWP